MVAEVASSGDRRTIVGLAWILAAALAALCALHVYWVFGGEFGLAAALGEEAVEPSAGLRAAAALFALLLASAAAGVLARVGVWSLPVPWTLLRFGAWVLVVAFGLVALVNATAQTALERYAFAPAALALTLVAVMVARSEPPS